MRFDGRASPCQLVMDSSAVRSKWTARESCVLAAIDDDDVAFLRTVVEREPRCSRGDAYDEANARAVLQGRD